MKQHPKIRKTINYLISTALALIMMYFSFRGVKWEDFVNSLKSCELGYIAISMIAGILAFWLRGLRWCHLLLPIDAGITRLTTFNAINIGYLANFVFPRIGEFVRCGVITKNSERTTATSTPQAATTAQAVTTAQTTPQAVTTAQTTPQAVTTTQTTTTTQATPPKAPRKATYDKVLGTVVLERSWDMLTMLLLLLLLLAFKWDDFGGFFIDKIWHPMQQRLDFSLWWLLLILILLAVAAILTIIATRHRLPLSGKIYKIFAGLLQGIGSCLKMKRKWIFFTHTILIWLMYWVMSWATMHAVPELGSLGPIDAMFLMLAGSFGWVVPVPGGFGAFHFIVSVALSTIYAIPFEMGIVFATLSHESQAITMALCGAISYCYEFLLHRTPKNPKI